MAHTTRKISSFSILVLFVCLSLIGVGLAYYVPFQSSATSELPRITVSFNTRNQLSPSIVENEITNRLEQVLCRIEGQSRITSSSTERSGKINLTMFPGTDMKRARFLVMTNINKVWKRISDLAYYPDVSVSTTGGRSGTEFMSYSLRGNTSVSVLSAYVEEKVKPALSRVKGVDEVRFEGRRQDGFILKYDQRVLDNLHVDFSSVIRAIQECGTASSLGLLPYEDEEGNEVMMRFRLQNDDDPFDFLSLYVTSDDGVRIPLSSIVTIVPDSGNEDSSVRINGQNTVFVYIVAKPDANQIVVSRHIRDAVDMLKAELPPGYELSAESDMSEKLKAEAFNIGFRLILTVIILLAFMFLSIRNVRLVADTMLSLLVAMLVALIGYFVFKVEVNMYALAAITISSNLMIDNIIVMSNQVLYRKNINAFMPMLAATLTTVGALSLVFFVGDREKVTLREFSEVLIINLFASLFVATFFVPALLEQTGLSTYRSRRITPRKLMLLRLFNRCYERLIVFLRRHRKLLCVLLVLSFGLPVFLLPVSIIKEGKWVRLYNKTLGSDTYIEYIKPWVDKYIGGSLYRFCSYNDKMEDEELSYDPDRPVLIIGAKLPSGAKSEMLDIPIKRMEHCLASQSGIRQFNTHVNGTDNAFIEVFFSEEACNEGAPVTVRGRVIQEALSISGLTWRVTGPGNMMFSNTPVMEAGRYAVTMNGYNYDRLRRYAAQFRDSLESVMRVRNVTISSRELVTLPDYKELTFDISERSLSRYGVTMADVIGELSRQYGNASSVRISRNGAVKMLLPQSYARNENDIWALTNTPLVINGKEVKLSEIGTFEMHVAPMSIERENRQYVLLVQCDYKGDMGRANDVMESKVENFSKLLPLGYTIRYGMFFNRSERTKTTALVLLVIIGIIYVTTCVLLNSFRQPFAIIMVIPVAFIGLFLAFSWLRAPFGQGGMASMVLLCGLTVNANIYLTYEYNEVRRKYPRLSEAAAFVKAWNRKIGPVFLTVLSTILGFLPFVIENSSDNFWYGLAVGTMSGLAFTMVGIFIFLPVFLIKLKKR